MGWELLTRLLNSSKGRKPTLILRTQLSVRVNAILEKLYGSSGPELRRSLFSLKQIFQVRPRGGLGEGAQPELP